MNDEPRTKNNLVRYLLFLFGLLLPTQFGKHFWPWWSYVLGIRVDYLSPTIYVTDILTVLIVGMWIWQQVRTKCEASTVKNYKLNALCLTLYALFLAIGIFLSQNPLAGWYGFLKLVEFVSLGFALKDYFGKYLDWFLLGLIGSVLYEGVLVIWQFFMQSSVGGIWYFLGERTFSSQTPGIANMSLGGELSLRPYGTFSHPNVLASYFLISLILLTELRITSFKYILGSLKFMVFILASITLFLTFSRSVIFLWCIFVGIFLWRKLKARNYILYSIIFLVPLAILIISPLRERFLFNNFSDESISTRIELVKASLLMIKTNPLFGLGLANFFSALPEFSFILFRTNFIQPVHNIFLLVASETGIPGLLFFLWFLWKTIKNFQFSIFNFQFQMFFAFVFLGNVDHYFLTLQQGQLLATVIFALCWM